MTTNNTPIVVAVTTVDQMLYQGLRLIGFNCQRVKSVSYTINLERFCAHFGSNPIVYAQIWEDLQTTLCSEAMITKKSAQLRYFLMAIYFLKCYSTESQLAAIFKISERTVRKWCWFYTCRIQALKEAKVSKSMSLFAMPLEVSDDFLKIVWPTRWTPGHIDFVNEDIPVFLLTVDGVHCQIHEPMHPTKSKDSSYYSHKFRRAALNYELGVSVYDNALVWLNGPLRQPNTTSLFFVQKMV